MRLQRRRSLLVKQHQQAENFLEKIREKKLQDLNRWKQKHARMREGPLQQVGAVWKVFARWQWKTNWLPFYFFHLAVRLSSFTRLRSDVIIIQWSGLKAWMHRLLVEDWQEHEQNAGSLSKFNNGYEARHLSLNRNVTRHKRGTQENPHLLPYSAIPFLSALFPTRPPLYHPFAFAMTKTSRQTIECITAESSLRFVQICVTSRFHNLYTRCRTCHIVELRAKT